MVRYMYYVLLQLYLQDVEYDEGVVAVIVTVCGYCSSAAECFQFNIFIDFHNRN